MKKWLLPGLQLFGWLFISMSLLAQNDASRRYLNNIVDIGIEQFGLIVGGDGKNVYFITASQFDNELPGELPIVQFYRSAIQTKGHLIKKFTFKDDILYLYSAVVNAPIKYEPYNYSSILERQGGYYSFLDNGKSDSLWYINTSPFMLNQKISNEVVQFRINAGDLYFLGMPLVNDNGSLVGIISDVQGKVANTQDRLANVTFKCIDLKSVRSIIYNQYNSCKYFSLIESGQSATPCDIAAKIKQEKEREIKAAAGENKIYPMAFGPAFSVNANFSGEDGAVMAGIGFSLGANIYFNPDKGTMRVTAQPRYTYAPLRAPSDIEATSTIGFKPVSYRIRSLELPIVVEWIIKRKRFSNSFFGVGYIPSFQDDATYRYSTKNNTSTHRSKAASTGGFKNKIMMEIGMEGISRASFFASYQITPWNGSSNFQTQIENRIIYPFEGAGAACLILGVEFAFRLKGHWGLRSRSGE